MDQDMVDKLIKELNKRVRDAKEIYTTLLTLQKYGADFELPKIEELFQSAEGATSPTNSLSIRPDEFYNLTNTSAAEIYLKKIGHAVPLSEIFDALVSGGMRFTGDGQKNLNLQLTRSTRKFAKIGQGPGVCFGLLEWYPKRKRDQSAKAPNETGSEDGTDDDTVLESGLSESELKDEITKI
jgi:hypothetical protein